MTRFPNIYPQPGAFADGNHLWCYGRSESDAISGGFVVLDTRTMTMGHTIPYKRLGTGLLHQPGVPYVILVTIPFGPTVPDETGPHGFWPVNTDGSGPRYLGQQSRKVLGMAADGSIILWHPQTNFVSWDPVRNKARVIHRY